MQIPSPVANRCRAVIRHSIPERPCLTRMSMISDVFETCAPIISGRLKQNRPPAHIRRGRETGGKKLPGTVRPSRARMLVLWFSGKYNQVHSGSNESPGPRTGSWSSKACIRRAGSASMMPSRCSVRPIHCRRMFSSVVSSAIGFPAGLRKILSRCAECIPPCL